MIRAAIIGFERWGRSLETSVQPLIKHHQLVRQMAEVISHHLL
jgi:hypothetical protein